MLYLCWLVYLFDRMSMNEAFFSYSLFVDIKTEWCFNSASFWFQMWSFGITSETIQIILDQASSKLDFPPNDKTDLKLN